MKTLGPKFGPRLKEVQTALAAADGAALCDNLNPGNPSSWPVRAVPSPWTRPMSSCNCRRPEGWAGVADRGTQVAVDTRLTEELQEGMARDVVRQVQELRKQSGLEMEDRITLYLGTESPALRQAIEVHRGYICAETLAIELSEKPLGGNHFHYEAKVDGQPLAIELKKSGLGTN